MVDTAPLPSVVSLSDRAVDAEWLWLWCEKHDLWDKSTEDVVEEIVKPLTEHLQCRFVELASQVGSGRLGGGGGGGGWQQDVVGPADVFVSHCWKCPFGSVVAAAADRSRPRRRVWLDIFAVNQHKPNVDLKSAADRWAMVRGATPAALAAGAAGGGGGRYLPPA